MQQDILKAKTRNETLLFRFAIEKKVAKKHIIQICQFILKLKTSNPETHFWRTSAALFMPYQIDIFCGSKFPEKLPSMDFS